MADNSLTNQIFTHLPFKPNQGQLNLINALSAFILYHGPRDVFVINGYAGTGKTSVIGAVIRAMASLKKPSILLAPTGRAAKVAAAFSGHKASTVHKRIFHGNSLDPSNTVYFLAENRNSDTIFFVDEASLISDDCNKRNSLLQQLISHVYSAPGCALVLIGDLAQLPPVGQSESFAMNSERLKEIGLNPIAFNLEKPVRQAAKSGILFNATVIRKFLFQDFPIEKFRIFKKEFSDVEIISSRDLADSLSDSWSTVGIDETLIITRSNKRANNYNMALRNLVMDAENELQQGDRVVISKNNYFLNKINKLDNFLANGEIAEITWVGKKQKIYDRWFVDVELKLTDIETPIGAKIMLKSLDSEGPSLPKEEMERFYNLVLSEYDGELSKKIKGALNDPYYNALQVKYAYCVTCHKAQGGQWKHVYIDMGAIPEDALGNDFFRWLYTAVTRATKKIFFINPTFRIK